MENTKPENPIPNEELDDQAQRQDLKSYPKYAYERDRLMRNDSEKSIDSPTKVEDREQPQGRKEIRKKSKFSKNDVFEGLQEEKLHVESQKVEQHADPDQDGNPIPES